MEDDSGVERQPGGQQATQLAGELRELQLGSREVEPDLAQLPGRERRDEVGGPTQETGRAAQDDGIPLLRGGQLADPQAAAAVARDPGRREAAGDGRMHRAELGPGRGLGSERASE